MATAFGIPSSFLSAMENGRKSIPESFPERVFRHFGENGPSLQEWERLAADSISQLNVDLSAADDMERKVFLAMSRRFKHLPIDDKQEIWKLLQDPDE